MSDFGQVVNNNKDCIVALLRPRKPGDKFHLNVVPLPLRNFEWLKQTCWFMVLCFHSPAHVTLRYKAGNISFHPGPPKTLLEVLVHLGATRVDRELGIMSLFHDDFSEISLLRNNSPVLKHHGAITLD